MANTKPGQAVAGSRSSDESGPWIVALLVVLSLFMPWRAGDNTDVSWLIMICEKILDGQKLYVDILETNPPFSVALYIGPVWFARKLGLSAELMVQSFVYLAFFISLGLSAAVIRAGGLFRELPSRWVLPMLVVLLLFVPGGNFGQREHLGMMMFMPMLFLMMWRAEANARPPLGLALAVGLAASVLILIKPHWALGIALPCAVICWRRRSLLACITSENIVIGVLATAYLVIAIVFFPMFFDTLLPVLMRYYVTVRSSGNFFIALPAFVIFVIFIALQMQRSAWRVDVVIAIASATGFFIAMVYLGKYWGNHQYPFKIALLTALLIAVGSRWSRLPRAGREEADNIRFNARAALAVVACVSLSHQFYFAPDRQLVDAIKSRFDSPSVVQVSSDLIVGCPLTRLVNGRWLSAYAQDWIGPYALWGLMQGWYGGDTERQAQRDLKDYTDYVNRLVRDGKPDIILFDRGDRSIWTLYEPQPPIWVEWMRRNAEFRRLMGDYEEIARDSHIEVYARRPDAASATEASPAEG